MLGTQKLSLFPQDGITPWDCAPEISRNPAKARLYMTTSILSPFPFLSCFSHPLTPLKSTPFLPSMDHRLWKTVLGTTFRGPNPRQVPTSQELCVRMQSDSLKIPMWVPATQQVPNSDSDSHKLLCDRMSQWNSGRYAQRGGC